MSCVENNNSLAVKPNNVKPMYAETVRINAAIEIQDCIIDLKNLLGDLNVPLYIDDNHESPPFQRDINTEVKMSTFST